jgi:hypothetical protein
MNPVFILPIVSFGLGYFYGGRGGNKGGLKKPSTSLLKEIEKGIVFKNHVTPPLKNISPLLPHEKVLKEINGGAKLKKVSNDGKTPPDNLSQELKRVLADRRQRIV